MQEISALIVDDEKDIRALVSMALERIGIQCDQAADTQSARDQLANKAYHFCITDMKLPDGDGLQLIQHSVRSYPDMPIAMITAYGNMELGVNALKAGAFDVVAKPIDTQRLRELATAALKLSRVDQQPQVHTALLTTGESAAATSLRGLIRKIARTQAPVFIQGDPGTGKAHAARLIHQQSARADGPLVVVACGTCERAFEDVIAEAKDGSLLLQNVERLTNDQQTRLLGWLTNDDHPHDTRLMCSTSADLAALSEAGQFRPELFYRLKVVSIRMPALVERIEDLPSLCDHLINGYAQEWAMPTVTLSDSAREALSEHNFPGNLRELDLLLQRAFTLMESEEILATDLQFDPPDAPAGYHTRSEAVGDLEGYLERLEREAIEDALEATRWNKTAAAERLGISFRALRYRCKKLAIE